MNGTTHQMITPKRSFLRARGQTRKSTLAAIVMSAMALTGCTSLYEGEVGYVEGFHGGIAADEPRAALVGRDVLSAGGTAADAVTAMYFTLAVTMPSSAGLGGGGLCVSHDAKSTKTLTLSFLPGTPAHAGGERPAAVPGNARGFFALHSKYGRLRWETLVSTAENLARFGNPISRAFAQDLSNVGNALLSDTSMRAVFGDATGHLLGEGKKLRQTDLAGIMGTLRAQGPGDFYTGQTAVRLVQAYKSAGSHLTVDDLRNYLPTWSETLRGKSGNETVHFPGTTAGGKVAAAAWKVLEDSSYAGGSAGEKAQALAAAGRAGFRDATAIGRMGNPSATSFVAVDGDGSAVACAVTLNGPFGTGRMAPGTGVVPAALAGPGGRGPDALAVMMVINHNVNEFHYAAGASGGIAAPTALLNVAARALIDETLLGDAIGAARVHHGGTPDGAYFEQGLDGASAQALGTRAQSVPSLGRVTAIACPNGIPPNPENCAAKADPRGAGLGSMSEEN